MALGTKNNILVGAASVYLSVTPNTIPTIATPDPNATTDPTNSYREVLDAAATDWRNVGYTQDGLEVSTDPSYGEVEVDQLLDAALIFKDGMGLSVSTTFAEATLENLLTAWGQAPTSLDTTGTEDVLQIEGGVLGEAPLERSLAAIGNAPRSEGSNNYGERLYHVYRVLSVESTAVSLARADASTIPVTFRALPRDTDGKYGVVRDRLTV